MSRVRLILIEAEGDNETVAEALKQMKAVLENSKSPSEQRVVEFEQSGNHMEYPDWNPNKD